MAFVDERGLFPPCQHGFRKGYSTETATVQFVRYLHEQLDHKKYVVGVFFDLSRAFDSVNHELLARKLSDLGFRGCVNSWLLSYVRNRHMVVDINGVLSDDYAVSLGTPQGGSLAPLLFLLYVADLPYSVTSGRLFTYADDTTIVVAASDPATIVTKVNQAIEEFSGWCRRNSLVLNSSKTV